MSRRAVIPLIIVLAVAIIAIAVLTRREDEPRTAVATRGTLDVSIETVGSIVATREHVIRAGTRGVVDTVGVSPGDEVAPSDIIILLEREEFETQIQIAEQAVEDAEFALQIAEQERQDTESLAAAGDLLRAKSQLDEARRELEDANRALSDSAVLAPDAGIVLAVLVLEGEPVTVGQPVSRMYRRSDLRLVARVDELGLPSVVPGTPVTFRLDAFPEHTIDGLVIRTAPSAEQEAGVAFFSTEIEFDPPEDLDIRPGMNAEVSITTELLEDVLLIPESAVRSVGERAFVRVIEDGDESEVEISLGRRGGGMVEVVEGLQEGDRVVIE